MPLPGILPIATVWRIIMQMPFADMGVLDDFHFTALLRMQSLGMAFLG